jgi:hypothetical protein
MFSEKTDVVIFLYKSSPQQVVLCAIFLSKTVGKGPGKGTHQLRLFAFWVSKLIHAIQVGTEVLVSNPRKALNRAKESNV